MTESTLSYFFMAWLNPQLLLLTAAGTLSGIYVGAIPGLSVTMAVSILISFTFSWDVNNALALMVGVYCGGVYGGSRTAILLNIPGAPENAPTAFDGYPMTLNGQAGKAVGAAANHQGINIYLVGERQHCILHQVLELAVIEL